MKIFRKLRSQRGGTQKRLQIMGITVVVLSIGVGAYFTSYTSRQAEYFTNRNFRELAGYSEQISSRIVNVGDAFRNAVSKTVKTKSSVKEGGGAGREAIKCYKDNERPRNTNNDQSQKSVKETFTSALQLLGQTRFTSIKVVFEANNDDPTKSFEYKTSAEQTADLDDQIIAIGVVVENGTPWLELLSRNRSQTWSFSGKVNFNDLIKPLIGDTNAEPAKGVEQDDGFDDVIIARANDGFVIYDQGTPELNVTSLKDVTFFETPEKKLEFKSLTTTTSSAEVHLGGEDYRFYLQPVTLPLSGIPSADQAGDTAQLSQWVVGGLVKSGHFRHETWKISYTVLVFVTFLCALVALSWPLLKLVFIGPKDRLRLADVYLIGLSFLLGSALLTLFLLWSYTYAANQSETDRRLRELAQNVSERFQQEVDDALTELELLDSELNKQMPVTNSAAVKSAKASAQPSCYSRTRILDPLPPRSESNKANPVISPANECSVSRDPYPFFNAVVWMSESGQQEVLWTISPTLANLHNVKERPYFNEILNGHFLSSAQGRQFFLQSIASRATGSKTALISQPSIVSFGGSKGVVGMDINFLSVMDPVLPDGFGFRIIDDDKGTVLFQSAESKNWEENIYLECDNNPALRSLVSGRLGGDLDINYAGKSHHLHVKPLQNFPNWSLVVLRDKQPLRAIYLEIVTLAGFLFLGYAAVLFVIFLIVYLVRVNSWERMRWLWPSPAFSTLYGEIMLFNIFWGLLIVGEILFFDGLWLVLMVFFTSLFGITNLIVRPSFGVIRKVVLLLRLATRLDHSHVYALNIVLLLIIAGMLPATAFFKVTYNKGMALFTRQRQMSLWEGEAQRYTRINGKYSTTREASSPGPFQNTSLADAFITRRLDSTVDIYESFWFGTSHKAQVAGGAKKACAQMASGLVDTGPATVSLGMSDWIETRRASIHTTLEKSLREFPFVSGFVESDILARNRAADCSWVGSLRDENYTLTISEAWKGKTPQSWKGRDLSITTPLRKFQTPPWPTLNFALAALGLLSIPIGLFFLSRFAVGRIFLLHLEKRTLTPIPQNAFASTNQNLFVITGSPLIERDSATCNGDFHRINLKSEFQKQNWFESLKSQLENGKAPRKIVIDYFDYQITDLKKNLQKLELLEWLVANEKIVVIMSNADPSDYSSPEIVTKGKHKQELLLAEFADRWANVISGFIRVYLVDDGDAKSFQEALAIEETRLLASAESEVQGKRIRELVKFVRDEGSPRGCLQKIGLEIIKQRDFEKRSPTDLFKQFAGQGRLYYQRIWATCSEEERLTLMHLSEDRFLSRNDPQLSVLILKGLIVKAPELRLINQTFKHFLLTQCSQTGLVSIENQAKRNSTWHMLKIPFLIGLVAVISFLLLTQKDFYGSSLTIMTGLATGIPALFKVLSLVHGEGVGKIASSGAASQLVK